MNIVILQPMYLPWPGLFEQIRNADIFVHYDDAQIPQGRSFVTRVQLQVDNKVIWLSVPVKKATRNLIKDVEIDVSKNWLETHYRKLKLILGQAPYFSDVENIMIELMNKNFLYISELNIFFIKTISDYLGFNTRFVLSSTLGLQSKSSQKLVDICSFYKASKYITGHGAKNYLDHLLFEGSGIEVEYMNYNILPYAQNNFFTPYTTILDLLAYTGKNALHYMKSTTTPWKNFN